MPRYLPRAAMLAVLLLPTSACYTTHVTTARPLDEGGWELSATPHGQYHPDGLDELASFAMPGLKALDYDDEGDDAPDSAGTLDLGLRVGVGRGVDIGATLSPWTGSFGVDVKWNLFENERIALSVDPGAGVSPH
jgi:hypothetical protein